jgi:hypothetical protein
MSRYIGVYVKHCDLCNRTKLQHRWPSGELHLTETPEERWQVISVNFIVELPDRPVSTVSETRIIWNITPWLTMSNLILIHIFIHILIISK